MRNFLSFLVLILLANAVSAQTFSAQEYYQLRDGNVWRYTAPPTWKAGDYISQIVADEKGFLRLYQDSQSTERTGDSYTISDNRGKGAKAFQHYDATKAAKLLLLNKNGIYYLGEEFAGGESYARFDVPILWFPAKFKLGDKIEAKASFTRVYKDGKRQRRHV